MQFKFYQLKINELGLLPIKIKLCIYFSISILILYVGYRYDITNNLQQLKQSQQQETQLKCAIETKQQQLASFIIYRQQYSEVVKKLRAFTELLPSKLQLQNLFEDLSKLGNINDLEFKFFKPSQEFRRNDYIALPIEITAVGQYHKLLNFIAQLTALKYLVVVQSFNLKPLQINNQKNALILNIRLLAYHV